MTVQANTCPYCGGPYTLMQACLGPRTSVPTENCCADMRRHLMLIIAALREETDDVVDLRKRGGDEVR